MLVGFIPFPLPEILKVNSCDKIRIGSCCVFHYKTFCNTSASIAQAAARNLSYKTVQVHFRVMFVLTILLTYSKYSISYVKTYSPKIDQNLIMHGWIHTME